MGTITFRVYSSFDDLKDQVNKWDLFAIRFGSPVYMSYDWCCTWWKHYGRGKRLIIVVFYDRENIVALLPMYIDDLRILFFKIRIARLVGSNIPPKVFDPPIVDYYAVSVFKVLTGIMFEGNNCDLISLGPVSKQYRPIQKLRVAYQKKQQDMARSYEEIYHGVHSAWSLPNSFEEFMGSLSKKDRKKYKSKYELKYLKKHYEVKVDVFKEPNDIVDEFKKFQEMHTQQWQGQGRPGHFKAWHKADIYNVELVRKLSKKNRVRLIRISADNTAISYDYGFVYGNSFFWELPARVTERQWSRFDLGRTGAANMIRVAIQEGLNKIEGGLGHYDYKIRLGAKEFETIIMRFTANRWQGRLKKEMLRIASRIIDVVYFKIWYQRVQPHLPKFFQRPIWSVWIRLTY